MGLSASKEAPPSPSSATPPLHDAPPSPSAASPPLHEAPPPSAATPQLHQTDADEEDENVKQLNECSQLYLSLQECLARTDRNWKSCQPEFRSPSVGGPGAHHGRTMAGNPKVIVPQPTACGCQAHRPGPTD